MLTSLNTPRGTVKHLESVMVQESFSHNGTGKSVMLPRNITVNKDTYLKILADHLEDSFTSCLSEIFMQDGSPAHTTKLICEWIEWVDMKTSRTSHVTVSKGFEA